MPLFVTVTPTIMDGTVVRWFTTAYAMEDCRPVVSASREGVSGHHGHITPELFDAAWAAHLAIKAGQDVNHLATHRRRGVFSGPFESLAVAP